MSKMMLEIVTPERKVYAQEVQMIVAKGAEGELGILPNHIPMVTPLRIAPLKAKRPDNAEDLIAVNGGFMEVRKDKVVVLAETAELPEDIDEERARRAKERAEQRLASKSKDEVDFKRAEMALQKAINRIRVRGGE